MRFGSSETPRKLLSTWQSLRVDGWMDGWKLDHGYGELVSACFLPQ